MEDLFAKYGTIIVFLHIVSAVIWVGGMIATRIAAHPAIQGIDDPKIKLGKTLQIVGRLFYLVIPFVLVLFVTGFIMVVGTGLSGQFVYLKEAIWVIMTINFYFMYKKRSKAQKLFDSDDLAAAKKAIFLLPNLMLPINIILGLGAIFLGVSLRGY